MSQIDKPVIPGEPRDCGRDPESRKVARNQIILDPGSHPAARDLAGMTNCDTASDPGGIGSAFHRAEEGRNKNDLRKEKTKPQRLCGELKE